MEHWIVLFLLACGIKLVGYLKRAPASTTSKASDYELLKEYARLCHSGNIHHAVVTLPDLHFNKSVRETVWELCYTRPFVDALKHGRVELTQEQRRYLIAAISKEIEQLHRHTHPAL